MGNRELIKKRAGQGPAKESPHHKEPVIGSQSQRADVGELKPKNSFFWILSLLQW